jgi:hypothetical protein
MTAAFLLTLALILSAASAPAQSGDGFDWRAFHKKNDAEWAKKTGLRPDQVRAMRLVYAGTDNYPANTIDDIDAATLKNRDQVLFVSSDGSGHCLTVMVFAKRQSAFEMIWSVRGTSGGGFCRSNAFTPNPRAYVGRNGSSIIIDVPACPMQYPEEPNYPKLRRCYGQQFTYAWTGSTYRYAGSRKVRFR